MANQSNDSVLGKRTVLIIEDDELNREMLGVMLEDKYKILQAENGLVGLQVLQERYRDIALVILDVQMPVMNGYEFLKKVKQDELLSTIPVIVATGSNRPDEEEYCLDLGAADFVSKPYNRHIVQLRIANIISLRESVSTLSEIEYDDLTGIYTRQAFMHHAEQMMKLNPDVEYNLIISNIEDFRLLNNRYGRYVCDKLLLENARLLSIANFHDTVYGRFGDHRFISLYPEGMRIEKPIEQISIDTETANGTMHVTCRMKYAVKRKLDHNVSLREHCSHVLGALDTIKHQYGKYFVQFDNKMQEELERRNIIENTMQKALAEKQFVAYYQPKHDALTGKLVGAECLIRWTHPQYGFMSPAEFIPVFEETGFISEVDLYIWNRTCENIKRWIEKGLTVVPISVNCSRIGFLQQDFIGHWVKPVQDNNVTSDFLHLEVTESLFTDNLSMLMTTLENCRNNGFLIELDDFGTGYSSLSTLEQLPLDIVKLDISLVRSMNMNGDNIVVPAMVDVIHNLGKLVVAEGVETEGQLERMRSIGVDIVQGYYYSKPLSEEDFEEYLRTHN